MREGKEQQQEEVASEGGPTLLSPPLWSLSLVSLAFWMAFSTSTVSTSC